jgi:hypothetical protein
MNTFIPGQILKPVCQEALIGEPMRVLYQSWRDVLLIPIEPRKSTKRTFYVTYRTYSRNELEAQCRHPNPMITVVPEGLPEGDQALTDEELERKYGPRKNGPAMTLQLRNERWSMIEPLVTAEDAALLFDREIMTERIHARARELAASRLEQMTLVRKLQQLLFCYWAGNSMKRALTPQLGNCGGRGKTRKAVKQLGRRPAGASPDDPTTLGYVLTDQDKDIIDYSWRHFYVRRKTMMQACRKMWETFYSISIRQPDGTYRNEYLKKHQRPSAMQFRTWGEKRNPDDAGWKRQFPATTLARIDRCLKDAANAGIVAVGQRAAVDSSPPDMEFVSLLDRLKRIGGGNRILVVDMKRGYIPGLYYGIDAPSAKTVNLAFLHAMSDKREQLEFLGLDIPPEDWIPIAFSSAIADNTDLRCQAVHDSLATIGTHCLHVPVARSDMNAMAETPHHVVHRMVDHQMDGSTYGQRTERGETSATERARHTILEGLRECMRAIHAYNTKPLEIEPTLEMIRSGVELTRLGLTRWDIERGKVARSLLSIEEARACLLPRCKGTFTKSGVRLLRDDKGVKRVFLRRLRYFSNDPDIVRRLLEAKLERRKQDWTYFDDVFLYDPYCIRRIWYRDLANNRLIELTLVSDDADLPYEASLADIFELEDTDAIRRPQMEEERQRIQGRIEAEQEQARQQARADYDAALDLLEKPPSKVSLKANKQENREVESGLLRDGMPIPLVDTPASPADADALPTDVPTCAPEEVHAHAIAQQQEASKTVHHSIFGGLVARRNQRGDDHDKP